MRVVVYAEGQRELGAVPSWAPRPMDQLPEDDWGPAHHLVARSIEHTTRVPAAALRFVEPLRDGAARLKGQDLLDRTLLERIVRLHGLLRNQVELMVVLLDADGDPTRHAALVAATAGWSPSFEIVFGVPEPEFEAWLLGDLEALRTCSARELPTGLPPPEKLPPRDAKSRFGKWEHATPNSADARADVCRQLDLLTVASHCPTFDRFLRELS